jgi:hypothetical protein
MVQMAVEVAGQTDSIRPLEILAGFAMVDFLAEIALGICALTALFAFFYHI